MNTRTQSKSKLSRLILRHYLEILIRLRLLFLQSWSDCTKIHLGTAVLWFQEAETSLPHQNGLWCRATRLGLWFHSFGLCIWWSKKNCPSQWFLPPQLQHKKCCFRYVSSNQGDLKLGRITTINAFYFKFLCFGTNLLSHAVSRNAHSCTCRSAGILKAFWILCNNRIKCAAIVLAHYTYMATQTNRCDCKCTIQS